MVDESIVSAVKQITGDSGILLGKEVSERKAGIWIEEPIKAQELSDQRAPKNYLKF